LNRFHYLRKLKQFVPLLLVGVAVTTEELLLDNRCFHYPRQTFATHDGKRSQRDSSDEP